ncbi:hypothetical protein BH09PAT4_BH09PAT4_03320 [soil metagenome]
MKRLKHIIALVILGVGVILPILISAAPKTASAATSWQTDATVDERVKSYLYIMGLANCIRQDSHGFSLSDLTSYKLMDNKGDHTDIGMIIDHGDGKVNCANEDGWMEDAFNLWSSGGILAKLYPDIPNLEGDAIAMACAMGWDRVITDKKPSYEDCIGADINDGFYYNGSSDGTKRGQEWATDWNGKLNQKDMAGSVFDSLGGPERYYLYSQTFIIGCKVEDKGLYADAGPEIKGPADSKDSHWFTMDVPNSDGTVSKHVYYSKDKERKNDQRVSVTFGFNTYKKNCADLADAATATAKDAADYLHSTGDQTGSPTSVDGSGEDITIEATCGATDDGFFKGLVFWANPLNWLICPLITGMSTLTRVLDSQIVGMLCINEQDVFGATSSTCGGASSTAATTSAGYKSAWNVFRIISLGLLAIAALIMVLSQTSGFEIVDAYTIRKTLPRILIAGIGITLSWALLQWFVGLTNDLGVGVRGLIYSPFQSAVGDGHVVLAGGGGAIGKLLANAYLISLGAFGFLTLLATGALAVIIAFAVLTVRNMLIVILLISAPIAIAAYVLPNTQNIWKTWWSFFSKALMVFPIITAFIAIGHVFAALSVKQGGLFNSLIGFAAYFAPYFLLPATFRFAGGALATIGGFANDRGRGAFDGLKNKRKAIQADRVSRAQNGSLWDPNSFLNRKMGNNKYLRHVAPNSLASWATDPLSNAAYYGQNVPGLKKKGRGISYAIDSARAEQTMKLFEEINKFGDNDKAYRALTGEYSGFSPSTQEKLRDKKLTSAPTSIRDLQTLTDVLGQSDSETERTAAAAIGGSMGRLATLYQDGDMTKASIQGAGLLGLAAHGFASGQDIAQTANSLMDSGGSMGFANAIAQQSQVLVARSRPDAKAGYGTVIENGRFVSGVQAGDGRGGTILPKDAHGNVDAERIAAERTANGEVSSEYLGSRGFEVLKAVGPGDIAGAKGGMLRGVEKSGIADHLRYILKHGDSAEARGAKDRLAAMSDDQKKTALGRELKRLANAAELYVPMRDQLLQSASYYSHASSDIKSNAAEILTSTGHGDLVAQYDARRSAGHDPSEHEGFPDPNEGNEGH